MTGETARRCKGQRGISEIHLATELWTPVICPKFTVVFPPGGWNLIPSLWGICDSPNFDVQGRCWFLLCHGWRCISHGSNWLFAIDSFYRFDLNLEVFLVWWLRRRRDDFRSRRSFCFCQILRFDLYCDIATRCLCLNGAEWGDVLDGRPIVHREDLRPYRNTGTKTFSSLNIHVLQVQSFLWMMLTAIYNSCNALEVGFCPLYQRSLKGKLPSETTRYEIFLGLAPGIKFGCM